MRSCGTRGGGPKRSGWCDKKRGIWTQTHTRERAVWRQSRDYRGVCRNQGRPRPLQPQEEPSPRRGELSPAAPPPPSQTSVPQNCERVNFCNFKQSDVCNGVAGMNKDRAMSTACKDTDPEGELAGPPAPEPRGPWARQLSPSFLGKTGACSARPQRGKNATPALPQ